MRLPNRISVQANTVVKSLGYDKDVSPATVGIAVMVEELLQRGFTTNEVANVMRPLTPALNEVVKSLRGME